MESQRQVEHPYVGAPIIGTTDAALDRFERGIAFFDDRLVEVDADLELVVGDEHLRLSGRDSHFTLQLDRPLSFARRHWRVRGGLGVVRAAIRLSRRMGITTDIVRNGKTIAVFGHGVESDTFGRILGIEGLRLTRSRR